MDDKTSETQDTTTQTTNKNYKRFLCLSYKILAKIKKDKYEHQISTELSISQQLCNYYLKKMTRLGWVRRVIRDAFVLYKITESGEEQLTKMRTTQKFSLSVTEKHTRLHNLAIKFNIIKDNPAATFDRKVEINHWVKQYSSLNFPIGITIEKTTKSVIVYFHQFTTSTINFLDEFYSWVLKGINYAYYYMMREKNIQIDIFNAEIIRMHIANESPEFNSKVSSKATTSVNLGRKAHGIYPSIEDAKVWIDRSFGNVDVESNDMTYEEKLGMMPELIYDNHQKFLPVVEKLTQQINLHLEVQENQLEAVKALRSEISSLSVLLKKINGVGDDKK